ncbi:MAG: pyridoxal phosphate-dependent aminotransferase [Ignavibacteriales bacterium]|nr:pyridoxal phosphate-dependent aminotransferase [Ignavibacteriales bacterium]
MAPNQLSDLIAAKRQRREVIIDLTESNPTRCGISYPKKEIIAALADASSLLYQPEPRGLLIARKAIADYYTTLGASVAPEHILLTASTSEAYSFLFKLLCNAGDEVIVPQPSYPLLEYLCQLNDVALRQYRLVYDGEWHIDFESLQSAFTSRTRAIVLVHPNNPTGSYLKQNEFEQVCTMADEHQCAVIADEVFQPYSYFPDARRANVLALKSSALLFSLNGISKLLGLPQLKLSWIVINGTSLHTVEALNRLDIIADTFLSVNTPVQTAIPMLLSYASDIENQIRLRIQTNYTLLQQIFAGSSASLFQIEGGWYAILQLPQIRNDGDCAIELLQQQNILVHPGHFFDMKQTSCIVLSLLPPSDLFANASSRIRLFVEQL